MRCHILILHIEFVYFSTTFTYLEFCPVSNLSKQRDIIAIALGFLNSVYNLFIYDLSELSENETGLKYSMSSAHV